MTSSQYFKGLNLDGLLFLALNSHYNGNIPLKLRVVNTQEEAYEANGTKEKIGVVKGAYHPKSGFFIFAASNLRNEADARATMRHEILTHYGLNTFNKEDKKTIERKEIEALYSDYRYHLLI